MLRIFVFIPILTCFLLACSPQIKPVVWTSKDFSISNRSSFDIQPVSDASHRNLAPEILLFLNIALKEQFVEHNLRLIDSGQKDTSTINVQTHIYDYKVQAAPSSKRWEKDVYAVCILRTRLYYKTSDDVIAEIFTVNQLYFGSGLLEAKIPESVLRDSATTLAKEVAKMI